MIYKVHKLVFYFLFAIIWAYKQIKVSPRHQTKPSTLNSRESPRISDNSREYIRMKEFWRGFLGLYAQCWYIPWHLWPVHVLDHSISRFVSKIQLKWRVILIFLFFLRKNSKVYQVWNYENLWFVFFIKVWFVNFGVIFSKKK